MRKLATPSDGNEHQGVFAVLAMQSSEAHRHDRGSSRGDRLPVRRNADRRRFKLSNIVDEHTPEGLVMRIGPICTADDVVAVNRCLSARLAYGVVGLRRA